MSTNANNTTENNAFVTITINKEKMDALGDKGKKVIAKVKEKASKLTDNLVTIDAALMLDTDATLEDFYQTLKITTPVEKAKLIAWGASRATNEEVRKYCRIRSGGAIGVAAIVAGALYYTCS